MKVKKVILPILVLLCMGIIFSFSNQDGEKSKEVSDGVVIKIVDTTMKITNKNLNENDKKNVVETTGLYVRKLAHFSIYLLLGILVFMTLKVYNIEHPLLFTVIFCFIYACSDEIHQLFISERAGRILDVLIDTSGAFLGSFILSKIYKIKNIF